MAVTPDSEKAGAFHVVGILLAAGKGKRFDPSGINNKLLQPLSDGEPVVAAAARSLISVAPRVCAVVRPDAKTVASCLQRLGCEVSECATADDGMAASLVHGLALAQHATGWIIALGDMPHVRPTTILALSDALAAGADIAVPLFDGRRGNPVAFSRYHLPRLLALRGDRGARDLLRRHPVVEIVTDDPGIHHDIDTASDMALRNAALQPRA